MNQPENKTWTAAPAGCQSGGTLPQTPWAGKQHPADQAAPTQEAGKELQKECAEKRLFIFFLFSAALFLGMTVCLICDCAICGGFTWSRIPAISIALAWVISSPVILLGTRGLPAGLLSLSIFIGPYLFLLSRLLNVKEVFSIGAAMAAVSAAFLWIITAVFRRAEKAGRWTALGITFLSAVPFLLLVNGILSRMIAEPLLDLWDLSVIFLLLTLASASFLRASARKKGGA